MKQSIPRNPNNRTSRFLAGDFDDISNVHASSDFSGMGGHGQMGDFWSDLRDKVLGVAKTQIATATGATTTTPTTTTTTTTDNTMKYVMYGGIAIVSVGLMIFILKKARKN